MGDDRRPVPDTPRPPERGASAVEYALVVSSIAAVIVLVLVLFGDNVRDLFQGTCRSVVTATASCED